MKLSEYSPLEVTAVNAPQSVQRNPAYRRGRIALLIFVMVAFGVMFTSWTTRTNPNTGGSPESLSKAAFIEIMDDKHSCSKDEARIILNNFFTALSEYQAIGSKTRMYTRTMSQFVSRNVVVIDKSNPRKFAEGGRVYKKKGGFKNWVNRMSKKDSFDVVTNFYIEQMGKDALKLTFLDESISEKIPKNLKLSSKDDVNLPKKYVKVRREGGFLIGRVSFDRRKRKCVISRIIAKRKFVKKGAQLNHPKEYSNEDIESANALHEIRKELRAQHVKYEAKKREVFKRKEHLTCVSRLEEGLITHDGSYETLGDHFDVNSNVKVSFVDQRGEEKSVSGAQVDELATSDTKVGNKLHNLGNSLRKAKLVEKDDKILAVLPDKTVVEMDGNDCTVTNIFVSTDDDEFHPQVKDDIIFVLFIVAVVVYVAVDYGVGTAVPRVRTPYLDSKGGIRGSDKKLRWMTHLPDHVYLNRMSVPAAHDAGARIWPGGCQSKSLTELAEMGIRFFDLRLKWHNNKWEIFHGSVKQNVRVSNAIAQLGNFVRRHPREVILVSLLMEGMTKKLSGYSQFKLRNALYWNRYMNLWKRRSGHASRWSWQLRHLRGKLVPLCYPYEHHVSAFNYLCGKNGWGAELTTQTVSHWGTKKIKWGHQVPAQKYMPAAIRTLKDLSNRPYKYQYSVSSKKLTVVDFNGYCYVTLYCRPVQAAFRFAQIGMPIMWNDYLRYKSYPRTVWLGMNAMDFPGQEVIGRIIAANNHYGRTGVANAPTRPPPQKKKCFSSENYVRTSNGMMKSMADVAVGDLLKGVGEKSQGDAVYFQGHRTKGFFEFIRIHTTRYGKTVSGSADHFIPVLDASRVNCVSACVDRKFECKVDDCAVHMRFGDTVSSDGEGGRVFVFVQLDGSIVADEVNRNASGVVVESGLYNPYTMSGMMVVNDVVVSCHSEYVFDGVVPKKYESVLPVVYQMIFAPFRFVYWLCPECGVRLDEMFPLGIEEYKFVDVMFGLGSVLVEKVQPLVWCGGLRSL